MAVLRLQSLETGHIHFLFSLLASIIASISERLTSTVNLFSI